MAVKGKCRKRRYRDRIAAEFALSNIRHRDSAGREKQEQRSYQCPRCRGWHLTSMAAR